MSAIALLLLWASPGHAPTTLWAQEQVSPPAATPDAGNGLDLFAERCAACHGPTGQGDGEMAAQLPRPPAALGSQAFVDEAVPAAMFDVITHGIIEAGMPPFGPPGNSDPLTEQERWDLVAAVFSLGTAESSLQMGQAVYEASCQECHAADGSGADGALDLRDAGYWLERSNRQVAAAIAALPDHEQLALEEGTPLQAATSYARSFSYLYASPLAAFEPLEAATISGVVTNETTSQPLQAGTPATLSAFTADFQPSMTLTTTLDSEGGYSFDLTMTPPDLVYVVTVQHEGLSYGSDFGRLERDNPTLTLDIPVYDLSTDAASVTVDQLHIIVQFGDGLVQVSELYQFSQNATVVYVGDSGFTSDGTVRISLPPAAESPAFDRSFGGMESFFPAENIISTGPNEWSDTVPLRPGPGSLSLLTRYSMPYDDHLALNHPVHYPVRSVNLVLPDAGVSVSGAGWQGGEPQMMGSAGAFLTYNLADIAPGQEVAFTLQGTPRVVTAPGAAVAPQRNQTSELLLGGGVLLLALAAGAFVVRQWQSREQEPDEDDWPDETGSLESTAVPDLRQELLRRIAALDDAYDAGELSQTEYKTERAALKDELLAIWNE